MARPPPVARQALNRFVHLAASEAGPWIDTQTGAVIVVGEPSVATRAPVRELYFHNGFAADLDAVVDFYDTRFHIGFTKQDKADLVTFLRSL